MYVCHFALCCLSLFFWNLKQQKFIFSYQLTELYLPGLSFKLGRKQNNTDKNTYMSFTFNYAVTFTSTIYFFLWIQIALLCPFISDWRIPISIPWRKDLLVINSLSSCLSGNIFNHPWNLFNFNLYLMFEG